MIRYGTVAAGLIWLLLSAPAHAQRVLPGDRPIVVPPVSGRELRAAEREAERAAAKPRENKALEDRGSSYDVTNGIQHRSLERALPR